MTTLHAIINGTLVAENEATILISDLSIQRGYGIFDYFRTSDNRPVFLEDHLDRFCRSASEMRLDAGIDREQIKKMIAELMLRNNLPDSGIRITLTGGYSENGYTLAKPNLLITQAAFTFPKESFNTGIGLVTYEHQRQLPQVKTIDYLQAIYLQPFIEAGHADDVLYHHQTGVCECPRANFFIVTDKDEVITPASNILKGITRKKILGFSEFNVKEGAVSLQQLENIREAFITSTTKNVLPVLKIDGKMVGNGKPGELTTRINQQLLACREQQ